MSRVARRIAFLGCVALGACGRSGFEGRTTPDRSPAVPTAFPTPGTVTLVQERFDAGSAGLQASVAVVWNDNDSTPGSFEVYTSSGAGARGMSATYDADNDPATAQIPIPGGIEVNDASGNVTLTATFTLPPLPSGEIYAGGTLQFWAGLRGTPSGQQTIDVKDLTSGNGVTGTLQPTLPGGAAPREWTFNSMAIPFTSALAGHQIQVRFHGAGTSAEGLELADVLLTAATK